MIYNSQKSQREPFQCSCNTVACACIKNPIAGTALVCRSADRPQGALAEWEGQGQGMFPDRDSLSAGCPGRDSRDGDFAQAHLDVHKQWVQLAAKPAAPHGAC